MTASVIEVPGQLSERSRFERNRRRGQVGRLPKPLILLWSWQNEGACQDANPTLFYHPEGERGQARAGRTRAALAVCAGCPVIQACRDHALAAREPYGVWGGLTVEDREEIRMDARQGRSSRPGIER